MRDRQDIPQETGSKMLVEPRPPGAAVPVLGLQVFFDATDGRKTHMVAGLPLKADSRTPIAERRVWAFQPGWTIVPDTRQHPTQPCERSN